MRRVKRIHQAEKIRDNALETPLEKVDVPFGEHRRSPVGAALQRDSRARPRQAKFDEALSPRAPRGWKVRRRQP